MLPREGHVNSTGVTAARVVHDLREAEYGVVEAIIEAMHEHQHMTLAVRGDMRPDPFARVGGAKAAHPRRHEIRGGIARHVRWPLHLAGLAQIVGGYGNDDMLKESSPPRSPE